uniref:Uncharacterized protein n=1 Tax=Amphimedon queenslandica TaxID=400682 RepID=A0A1X7UHP4_AMPQE
MRFYTIFSIYGLTFICAKFFDISISSFDVFDLMPLLEFEGNSTCSLYGPEDSNVTSWIFYCFSILITFIFLLFFCTCNLVCICLDDDECGQSLSSSKMKALAELSIYFVFFNPISHVNLLLNTCFAGYVMVSISIIAYFVTVNILVTMFAQCFHVRKASSCGLRGIFLTFFLVFLHTVQISACFFSLAVFYTFPENPDLTNARYSFSALVALIFFSTFLKGTTNRLSLYTFLFRRRDHFFCERCCIDAVATFIHIFSSVFMVLTILRYYFNSGVLLHFLTLVLLLAAILGSLVMSLFNFYVCFTDKPDSYLLGDDGEELIRLENGENELVSMDETRMMGLDDPPEHDDDDDDDTS